MNMDEERRSWPSRPTMLSIQETRTRVSKGASEVQKWVVYLYEYLCNAHRLGFQ